MAFSSTVKIVVTIVAVLGILFCLLGGVMFAYFPKLLQMKVAENLALSESSDSFKKWKDPPVPIYQSFYLFNVTNAADVNAKYTKPNLKEVGPYTFRVVSKKEVLKWDTEQGRMLYKLNKEYIFQRHMSSGDMSEQIDTLNIPYVGISNFLLKKIPEDLIPYVFSDLSANFRNMSVQLIERHTVDEMLFGGYYVELLDFLTEYADSFGMTIPQTLPNNTFGLYYGKNNSDAGVFSVGTGSDGRDDIAHIYSYNNMTALPYWKTKYCNMINGSDGSQFKSGLSRDSVIYAFSSEVCRSLPLVYTQDVEVKGIPAYRFEIPKSAFEDPAANKENQCYCDDSGCLKTGVLKISSCRKGAPVALSSPHLLNSDEFYTKKISGLKPDHFFHRTFLDIEPTTGIVLNAARRLQLNFHVKPVPGLLHLQNIPEMIFPIFWLSETGQVDEHSAELFKSKVILPKRIGEAVLLGAIVLGAFGILAALLIAMRYYSRRKVVVANSSNEVLHFKQGVPK